MPSPSWGPVEGTDPGGHRVGVAAFLGGHAQGSEEVVVPGDSRRCHAAAGGEGHIQNRRCRYSVWTLDTFLDQKTGYETQLQEEGAEGGHAGLAAGHILLDGDEEACGWEGHLLWIVDECDPAVILSHALGCDDDQAVALHQVHQTSFREGGVVHHSQDWIPHSLIHHHPW